MKTFDYRNLKSKNYFEGWYFRFSTVDINYAIIFAITKNKNDPHSFIQIFDDTMETCYYKTYKMSQFNYNKNEQKVSINQNYLSTSNIFINEPELSLQLNFTNIIPLQRSAMGYISKFPLECFQEVILLDGKASGTIYKKQVTGRIYIEKTYGSKFPVQWIWIQSNHSLKGSQISFSVGKIPLLGFKIKGFLCVLKTKEKLYHFYTGNFSKLLITNQEIIIKKRRFKLKLSPLESNTIKLVGPAKYAEMRTTVYESLTATLKIELFKDDNLVFKDTFHNVGYENMW